MSEVQLEKIPQVLRDRKQWVVWQLAPLTDTQLILAALSRIERSLKDLENEIKSVKQDVHHTKNEVHRVKIEARNRG